MYNHTRIPERTLAPMSKVDSGQPLANRRPIQDLLLKSTLALEGKRVPYKYEMEDDFDLEDLNVLLAHQYQLHPYLLLVLEGTPPCKFTSYQSITGSKDENDQRSSSQFG